MSVLGVGVHVDALGVLGDGIEGAVALRVNGVEGFAEIIVDALDVITELAVERLELRQYAGLDCTGKLRVDMRNDAGVVSDAVKRMLETSLVRGELIVLAQRYGQVVDMLFVVLRAVGLILFDALEFSRRRA